MLNKESIKVDWELFFTLIEAQKLFLKEDLVLAIKILRQQELEDPHVEDFSFYKWLDYKLFSEKNVVELVFSSDIAVPKFIKNRAKIIQNKIRGQLLPFVEEAQKLYDDHKLILGILADYRKLVEKEV